MLSLGDKKQLESTRKTCLLPLLTTASSIFIFQNHYITVAHLIQVIEWQQNNIVAKMSNCTFELSYLVCDR